MTIRQVTSQEINVKLSSEDVDYIADFTDILDTDTITSISGSDVNGVTLGVNYPSGLTQTTAPAIYAGGTVEGRTIAANKAVTFGVYGGTAGTIYEVIVTVRTTNGMTRQLVCRIEVQA